ncbi:MAG: type VI secretion system-associated protein TagF [Proteobacteria bacterium]|nr:type VI secretion system-associated protein TagF [candidate division Zixibacteria bacterium]NIO03474.1 type VI secretion system-associated protein TagF [Pseudomonadota bacterium]
MLGSIKAKFNWEWAAYGKHPATSDYFQIGGSDPIVKAFFGWLETGYQKLLSTKTERNQLHSWRFWSQGMKRDTIACGVCRDSSDSLGRPYPLTVMGAGALPEWKDHWDLLPAVFDSVWAQIECLIARRFRELDQLEVDLRRIKMPSPHWSTYDSQRLNIGTPHTSSSEWSLSRSSNGFKKGVDALLTHGEFCVCLDNNENGDFLRPVIAWSRALRARGKIVPSSLFMGGLPERSYLAVFQRSLNANDFVRLWSIS